MVMNQVTLLCAESFNDVSLLGALTSCPLLKAVSYTHLTLPTNREV